MNSVSIVPSENRYFKLAYFLATFTIVYNIGEGIVSTYFGYEDGSLALFGFGTDSFIEAISGFGIAHMLIRFKQQPNINKDDFERTALKITGSAFYILVAGLVLSSLYNLWTQHKPETTLSGVIISLISITVMYMLIYGKIKAGKELHSEAILADAQCTRVCIYMSVVLLLSSGIYELTKFPYVDIIGTLGLAYFSFKEGKECFNKAKSDSYCSCND